MLREQTPRILDLGGGGGANPAQGAAVWNPGAAPDPSGRYLTTWDEVMESFAETTGEYTLYLDDAGGGAFTIPVDTYDLGSRFTFSRSAPSTTQLVVDLADGAVLQNPAGITDNVTLRTNNTAVTAIEMSDGSVMTLDRGAILENAGTVPAIDVVAGDAIAVRLYRDSELRATSAAIATLGAGSGLTTTLQSSSRVTDDWVEGAPTSTLVVLADGTITSRTLASPPGTVDTTRTTRAGEVIWNPGAAPAPDRYVTTWDEVMAAFDGTVGDFRVVLDDSGAGAFTIPATTYDLDSRLSLTRVASSTTQLVVNVSDGGVLQNLAGVYRNVTLRTNSTAGSALALSDGRIIDLDQGAILENAGSVPAIDIGAGDAVGLNLSRGSQLLATGETIATIGAGSTLTTRIQNDSQTSDNWVDGGGTSTLVVLADGTYNRPSLASPPATYDTTSTSTSGPVTTGAYYAAGREVLDGVTATPGWYVLCEFTLDGLPTAAILDAIGLVSQGALTLNIRLYDVTAVGVVAGSTLSTSATTGARLQTADLLSQLVLGNRYQIEAECVGGALSSDFGIVRYVTLTKPL